MHSKEKRSRTAATLVFTTAPTASHFKDKFIHACDHHSFLLLTLFNHLRFTHFPIILADCAAICFQSTTKRFLDVT